MRYVIPLILLTAMLAGCGGYSIYREVPLDDSQNTSVIIDAKQRAIVSMKRDKVKETESDRTVVCSEPSPDAFAAVGQALSGSTAFSPVSKEVALTLSMALAESAGTIQRARSIQLLRDGLYAACVGYANGLSRKQYDRLLLRHQASAIVLLAIEQLTPQALPSSISLQAGGTTLQKGLPKKEESEEKPPEKPPKEPTTSQGEEGGTSGETPASEGETNKKKSSSSLGAGAPASSFFRVLIADPPGETDQGGGSQPSGSSSQTSASSGETSKTDQGGGSQPSGSSSQTSASSGETSKTDQGGGSQPSGSSSQTSASSGETSKTDQGGGSQPSGSSSQTSASSGETSKTDQGGGSQPSGSSSHVLPAPSPEVVQAVQYMVSTYLHDAMVFECLDTVEALKGDKITDVQEMKKGETLTYETTATAAGKLLDACLEVVKSVPSRGQPKGETRSPAAPVPEAYRMK